MYSFRDEWIDNEEEYSMVLDKSYSTLIMYIKENNLNDNEIKKELCSLNYKDFLHTDYWKAVRNERLFRDGYKCSCCGSEDNLQVHHITYKNHGNEHSHMDDLITLCMDCHREYHKIF